jgi:hypothetical protein
MSNKNKINRSIQFKNGVYSSIVTIVVIAIVVVINLIVASLPSDKTTFDTSGTDYYSIEDSTKTYLNNLSTDINFYMISDSSGQYDEYVETMCGVFEGASDAITFKKVDIGVNPTFTNTYSASEADGSSVIVENASTGKYMLVDYSDLVYSETGYDDSGNTQYTYYYDAEGQFLSAINYVSSEKITNVYEVTGHGEFTLSDFSFDEVLEKCNYTLADTALSLLTEDIPDDCDVLFLFAPYSDYSTDEVAKIEDYISNGGNVVCIYNNIYYGSEYYNVLTNFNSLLAYIGVEVENGWIMENDTNHYYSQYSQMCLIPNISSSSSFTSAFSNSIVLAYYSSPVKQIETDACTSTYTELLTTSNNYSVYFYDPSLEKATASDAVSSDSATGYTVDYTNSCSLATYVTSEFDDATAHSLVIGCDYFLYPIDSTYVANNYKMITNAIADMVGDDDSLYVEAKSLDEHLNVTTANQVNLFTLIYLVLIPLVFLMAGFSVWFLRRNK